MDIFKWYRSATRPRYFLWRSLLMERHSPHIIHCFGEFSRNTSDWLADFGFGRVYVVQRHSTLDLRTGERTDGFEHEARDSAALTDDAFVEASRAKDAPDLPQSDWMALPLHTVALQFDSVGRSDTERAAAPLLNGLRITQDARAWNDIDLMCEGIRIARFRMEGMADADTLRVFAVPDANHALLVLNTRYLWINLCTGSLLRSGVF